MTPDDPAMIANAIDRVNVRRLVNSIQASVQDAMAVHLFDPEFVGFPSWPDLNEDFVTQTAAYLFSTHVQRLTVDVEYDDRKLGLFNKDQQEEFVAALMPFVGKPLQRLKLDVHLLPLPSVEWVTFEVAITKD